MTIASTTNQISYTGDAVSVAFAYPSPFITTADIKVLIGGVLQSTGYSVAGTSDVTGNGAFVSGTVTFVAPPANGAAIIIYCDPDQLQSTTLLPNDPLPAKSVEKMIDKVTLLIQRVRQTLSQGLFAPLGETLSALPPAAQRANQLLSFDSLGNPIAVAPAAGTATALAALLASALAGQGAAQVGSNDAANYFNGATVEAILQEIGNPKGQFQLDGVNVLRYIPPAEWAAIMNGTSTHDLWAYLQPALTAEPNLIFPDGLFNIGTKLIPRIDSKISGINRRATKLNGLAPITLIEYPINNVDCTVENIFFTGSGCTGMAAASTAGANHDYLIRPHVRECDFAWELAYGINADLIYATIDVSTFGYYGTVGSKPAAGASTMVAIRSYSVTNGTTNQPNLNRVNDCNISAGSLTQAAVDISGGTGWRFDNTDWSFGGQALAMNNISLCKFTGTCWFEGNVATNQIIDIGACLVPVDFDGVNLTNNTAARIIRYPSSSASLSVKRCLFAFNGAAGFPLFDSTAVSNLLPANGCVEWYSNVVTNGDAANKIVTGTEFRGGKSSPRLTMAGITTTPGTISSSSDPGATISYNGVGDVSITASHPFATSTAKVLPLLTPQVGYQARVLVVSATQVRVQVQTAAGAAVDGAFGLVVYGS